MNSHIRWFHNMFKAAQPGTRIALVGPSSTAYADLLRSALAKRLTVVPLDPLDPSLRTKIEHSRPHYVLRTSDSVDEMMVERRDGWPDSVGVALILYTSGSTGSPKGVVISESALASNAAAVASRHRFRRAIHATCLSLHHCNAVCGSLAGTMSVGSVLRYVPATGYLEHLATVGADTAMVVPAVLERVVAEALPWPERLRYLVTAAAPLTVDLASRFHDLYGPGRLVQGYGMTEGVNFSTTMPDLSGNAWRRVYLNQRPLVGEPIGRCSYRVVCGEVLVRGDVMDGYWRDPEATEARFWTDPETGLQWLRSGDSGVTWYVDGRPLLRLTGRIAESINWRGSVTYPADIDERWGLRDVAVPIVALDGSEHPGAVGVTVDTGLDLRDPAPLAVSTAAMPRTSTGKPRRREAGRQMPCIYRSDGSYGDLYRSAQRSAQRLVESAVGLEIRSPSLRKVEEDARRLAEVDLDRYFTGSDRYSHIEAAEWAADIAQDFAQAARDGRTPERLDRFRWTRIMTEFPMNDYARLVAEIVKLRHAWGAVLEVGHGVGNTTRHLGDLTVVPTDLNPRFAEIVWNIDEDPPEVLGTQAFATAFGTNVLHCAADPVESLRRLRSLLYPGGVLVIGEGSPEPAPGLPWALTWAFDTLDGWWDRGGFRTREEWAEHLWTAGYRDVGWSRVQRGRLDLGGALWATA